MDTAAELIALLTARNASLDAELAAANDRAANLGAEVNTTQFMLDKEKSVNATLRESHKAMEAECERLRQMAVQGERI